MKLWTIYDLRVFHFHWLTWRHAIHVSRHLYKLCHQFFSVSMLPSNSSRSNFQRLSCSLLEKHQIQHQILFKALQNQQLTDYNIGHRGNKKYGKTSKITFYTESKPNLRDLSLLTVKRVRKNDCVTQIGEAVEQENYLSPSNKRKETNLLPTI